MPLQVGDEAPAFKLVDTTGREVKLEDLKGKKIWLAMYRPSACPLCNLQVSQVKKKYADLTKNGMVVLSVFESTPAEMKSFAGTQASADFPIYVPAPETNYQVYTDYQRARGCIGSVLGCAMPYHMCYDCKFCPAFLNFGGNPKFGCPLMNPKGAVQLMCSSRGLFTLPTDVLIDENGKVAGAHYGKVIGAHMSWEEIEKFANSEGAPMGSDMVREGGEAAP